MEELKKNSLSEKKSQKAEELRLMVLKSYCIMDTPEEEDLNALTRLAALICQAPIALITLVDEQRQWFKSKYGLGFSQTNKDISFCQFTIANESLFEVADTHSDERFVTNPLVTNDPNIRFYCGAPLINPDGYILGSLCVIDRVPRQLNKDQKEALELLAKQVSNHFELRRKKKSLEEEKLKLQISEKRYRGLIEHSQGFICIHDMNGVLLSFNPAASESLQFNPKEIEGKNMREILAPEVKHLFDVYLQQIESNEVVTGIMQVVTKSGVHKVWLYRNFRFEEAGKSPYIIGTALDITERENTKTLIKKAKDELEVKVHERTVELKIANTELQKINLELDTFIYRASHDLRGPLCSVKGLIDIALLDSKEPEIRQYLCLMEETVARLDNILGDLLNYANNRKKVVSSEPVYFEAIVNGVLEKLSFLTNVGSITIEKKIEEEALFYSDPDRITIIVTNILANIFILLKIKESKAPITVKITTASEKATIIVGSGDVIIEEEGLLKMFNMFYKIAAQPKSSGLGLYVVKEIVKKLQGTIHVTSQEATGTNFYIEIPNRKQ